MKALSLVLILSWMTLAAPNFQSQQNLSDHYQMVISGAGPGGLAAALSAIRQGIPADRILIIEKRPTTGSLHNYGSRRRVVVLDGDSMKVLKDIGAMELGAELKHMQVHLSDGSVRHYPNHGLWKTSIESTFGGRSLESLVSLGDIELDYNSLLYRFLRLGGHIVFNEETKLIEKTKDKMDVLLRGNQIEADIIVVAEGANSPTVQKIPKYYIAPNSTSHFLTLDLSMDGSDNRKIRSGDVISATFGESKIMVYAFASKKSVSVNMMLPPGVSAHTLRLDPGYHQRCLTFLKQVAEQFGLKTSASDQGSIYSGELTMRDRVRAGNVVMIGEALRTVDAISGTGANAAIMDGQAIGLYFSDIYRLGLDAAENNLIKRLSFNTRKAFELSLFFRELASMGLANPGLGDTMHRMAGLSSRDGLGSLMDTAKRFNVGLAGVLISKGSIENIMEKEMRLIGIQGPFKSPQRDSEIGHIHPLGVSNGSIVSHVKPKKPRRASVRSQNQCLQFYL